MRLQRATFRPPLWLVLIGIVSALLCGWFVLPFWSEGHVSAQVQYANGQPAACVPINFVPLEIIGPSSGRVRFPMSMPQTDAAGKWQEFNSWPYGWYQLTAYGEKSQQTPIATQEFTIWPLWKTHVVLTIDVSEQPSTSARECGL